jgi:hypothetical protein
MTILALTTAILAYQQPPAKLNVVVGGITTSKFEQSMAFSFDEKDQKGRAMSKNFRIVEGQNVTLYIAPSALCPLEMVPVALDEAGIDPDQNPPPLNELPLDVQAALVELIACDSGAQPEDIRGANPRIRMSAALKLVAKQTPVAPIMATPTIRIEFYVSPGITMPQTNDFIPIAKRAGEGGGMPSVNFFLPRGLNTRQRLDLTKEAQQLYDRWLDLTWSKREENFLARFRSRIQNERTFSGLPKETPKTVAELPPLLRNMSLRTWFPGLEDAQLAEVAKDVKIQQLSWIWQGSYRVRFLDDAEPQIHGFTVRRQKYGGW